MPALYGRGTPSSLKAHRGDAPTQQRASSPPCPILVTRVPYFQFVGESVGLQQANSDTWL